MLRLDEPVGRGEPRVLRCVEDPELGDQGAYQAHDVLAFPDHADVAGHVQRQGERHVRDVLETPDHGLRLGLHERVGGGEGGALFGEVERAARDHAGADAHPEEVGVPAAPLPQASGVAQDVVEGLGWGVDEARVRAGSVFPVAEGLA